MRSQEYLSSLVVEEPSRDRTLCFTPNDFSVRMSSSSLFTVQRLVLCSVVLLLLLRETSSAPVDEALARCTPGSPRRNTCEKCAKVTRDDEAYLLCCMQEGTQQWCEDYINFTLRP